MKRLAQKEHWTANDYYTQSHFGLNKFIPKSFSSAHFERIFRSHVSPRQSILEIGVAPGLHLVGLARKFSLDPYGLDYSAEGVRATRKNFAAAGYDPRHVFQADIFDAAVRKRYAGRFDIVYSAGFIEHFDDVTSVIEYHRQFTKPGGIVIITIPNLQLLAGLLPPEVLAVHNRTIMDPAVLRATLPKGLSVVASGYYGGLVNIGLVYSKKQPHETIRLFAYGLQRLTLDQLQRLLLLANLTIQPRATTPDIYIVARNARKRGVRS